MLPLSESLSIPSYSLLSAPNSSPPPFRGPLLPSLPSRPVLPFLHRYTASCRCQHNTDPMYWESCVHHLLAADGTTPQPARAGQFSNDGGVVEVFCSNKDRLRCEIRKENCPPTKV
jgi:hypothetical protein